MQQLSKDNHLDQPKQQPKMLKFELVKGTKGYEVKNIKVQY